MDNAVYVHLSELRKCRLLDSPVLWELKAIARVLLRALWNDLDFVHDLGMSADDRVLAESALSDFASVLSERLGSNETRVFIEYLTRMRGHFAGWSEYARSEAYLGYWNLQRFKYYQHRLGRIVSKNPYIAEQQSTIDLQRAREVLQRLVDRAPSTFYQLGTVLDTLLQLSNPGESAGTGNRRPYLITRIVSASVPLYLLLKRDIDAVHRFTPAAFEEFVAERLCEAGLDVRQIGKTNTPDGGVDLIATPRDVTFPFLLAVQVKHHHRPTISTGPDPVKNMQAVLTALPFHAGMIVTNTSFTPDAEWWASQSPGKIQLHDITSIRNWIEGRFDIDKFRNVPRRIRLTPQMEVDVW